MFSGVQPTRPRPEAKHHGPSPATLAPAPGRAGARARSSRRRAAPVSPRYTPLRRGVAQSGSAPALGAGGHKFESCRPDHAKCRPGRRYGVERPRDGGAAQCVDDVTVVARTVPAWSTMTHPTAGGHRAAPRSDRWSLAAGGANGRRSTPSLPTAAQDQRTTNQPFTAPIAHSANRWGRCGGQTAHMLRRDESIPAGW